MIHRHTLVRLSAILSCVFLLAGKAVAQVPDVEIYWNEIDKQDTVIDFDVTLEGFAVNRTFTVHNRSPFDVTIPVSLTPYFIILNTSDVPPDDPRKEEFGADNVPIQFPWVVQPDSTRTFKLIFRAYANNVQFPPDIITEALLHIRVVAVADTSGPGVDKVFLLRALKTTHPLASNTRTLSFDSVYVRPTPVPSLAFRVRNVTEASISVDSQIVLRRTQLITVPPELQVNVFPTAVFAKRDSIVWTATYAPVNQGLDSLTFIATYRLDATSATDSVSVEVSGHGVEQRLALQSYAFSIPDDASVVRDSTTTSIIVDFGEVPANGATYLATIIVRDSGNLNLGYDDERQIGNDPTAFSIVRRWSDGRGSSIRRGEFDTLVVAFQPTSSGQQNSSFVLTTDIKRRNIKGIPDGANTYTVYLRGFGERPQLQAPSLLDFGTIVLRPGCTSSSQRTLRIANVGNATLTVDSITIAMGIGTVPPFSAPNFAIGIGGSEEFLVTYEPAVVGPDSGTITLWTNAVTSRVDVLYKANVVPRDSTTVTIPPRTTARPGEAVVIPILVDGSSVSLTNLGSFTLTFDPSLLLYNSLVTLGTASEGATIRQEIESPRGILNVTLDKNGNYLDRDTLVLLRFNTYLGNKISAEVSLANSTTTFGNDGCLSVLDVRVTSGVFALDSICGLSYKTSGGPIGIQAAVYPNPATESASIVVVVQDTSVLSITVRDALGRSMFVTSSESLIPGVAHTIPLPLEGIQTGSYYIDLRSHLSSSSIPLVVRP